MHPNTTPTPDALGRLWPLVSQDEVAVSAVNATTATKYYYFNGQRIAMKKGDVLSYLHSDHLGSTVLETGNTGTMTADQQSYAYGRQRDTSSVVTDHKFTGQKQDATGLLYYGARYGW